MKKCPNCGHMNNDLAENCQRCREALAVESSALLAEFNKKALKRWHVFPWLALLLPALFTGFYALLVWREILPVKIVVLDYLTVEFVQVFSNQVSTLWGVFAIYLLPVFALIMIVRAAMHNSSLENAKGSSAAQAENVGISEAGSSSRAASVNAQNSSRTREGGYREGEYEEWFEPGSERANARREFTYKKLRAIDSVGAQKISYDESAELERVCDGLQSFCAWRGLSVSDECVRTVLSAMAASRLLWIEGKNKNITHRTLCAISEFFGFSLHIDELGAEVDSPESLAIRDGEFVERVESPFIVDVYSALYTEKAIRFAALDGVDPKKLNSCFSEYMDSVYVGERERQATVLRVSDENAPTYARGGRMKLPHNVWYAIIPMPGANLFERPEDAIPVDFTSVTELSDDAERAYSAPIALTVKRLAELASRAQNTHYIPEEYWKKIDQVEEYIAKRVSGYFLDNRSVRRIERYAAVYLAAGGKLSDALDCVVSGKLLHRLSGCPKEEISGDEHGAAALLDRVFGLDNMPKSIECARRLGASEENGSEAVADESDEGLTGTENESLEETDNGQTDINEVPEASEDAADDAEAETSADAVIDSINEESSEPEENVGDATEETAEESAREITGEPAPESVTEEASEATTENGPVNTDLIF